MATMIPRTMRHILDGVRTELSGEDGVILSGYRPRDPELDSSLTPPCLSEEVVDGAIYTVSQRQVQLHQGTSKGQQRLGVESDTTTYETLCIRSIKAGMQEKLVLHLLEAVALGDSSYVAAFLATYRTFTTTKQVLDVLLNRLEMAQRSSEEVSETPSGRGRTQLKSAASSVFSTWLEHYPEDFQEFPDLPLLERLATYLKQESPGSESERHLLSLLQQLQEKPENRTDKELDGIPESPSDTADRDAPKEDSLDILVFMAENVASQLTMLEAELFLKVVPYHCLGSIWSQRDKKGKEKLCPTIRATVRQFNKLTNVVISSCLSNTWMKPQQRARIFEKWIRVAEECRALKNFSSLYAIVSALQSNAVHRLKKTWEETSREMLQKYEDLSEIFSEKDNYSQSRELLIQNVVQGVVPYLGTFLKDLVMLDTAVKDHMENGYINFEKRRKEFEIIAQIMLLQSACRNYAFQKEEAFLHWFNSIATLSEADSHRLSCEIETVADPGTPTRPIKPTLIITHCADLLSSIASPAAGFISWDKPNSPKSNPEGSFDFSPPTSADCQLKPINPLLSRLTKHCKSPSVSSLDTAVLGSPSHTPSSPAVMLSPQTASVKTHRRSASCGSTFPANSATPPSALQSESECRIIRVRMDIENGTMYKSILVTSQDKTPAVIGKALEKHNQAVQAASNYDLVQILSEGKDPELTIPSTANVFYAMNSSSSDFILRRKGIPCSPRMRHKNETSSTFPKIRMKGFHFAKALFEKQEN
ncbi:ral guanine nucleotide dissociation stimulator isoform X2 [Latimeria chalumnae]|uniref:ral guanine nucleotide dissociation stimulator isoform X2 n=1 Tax=Latimeria chalumnae TaxID=7897 RepID=UPI00313D1B03